MPQRDLTVANRTALLGQIKSQLPSTSLGLLTDITGVPNSTIASVILVTSIQLPSVHTTQLRDIVHIGLSTTVYI
jgi:hypothetical protein